MTVREDTALVREYLAWHRDVKHSTKSTLKRYTDLFAHYLRFMDPKPLARLTIADCERFATRQKARGSGQVSRGTQSTNTAALRAFHAWLLARGYVDKNPWALVVAPKVDNRNPHPVDDAVWSKLWASDLAVPERVWLGLGYYGGLRRAELCWLTPDQVDLRGRKLVQFLRKGEKRITLPLGKMTTIIHTKLPHLLPDEDVFWRALTELVVERRAEAHLLPSYQAPAGTPWSKRQQTPPLMRTELSLNRELSRRLLPRVGLASDAFTPHALRHSACTNLLHAGLELHVASRLLSHEDVHTTMRYVKTSDDDLDRFIAAG